MRSSRPAPDALAAFLLSIAPLGLTACESPVGSFNGTACLAGNSELKPPEADFIALRSGADFVPNPPTATFSWGSACAKADDASACEQALAALPIDPPLVQESGEAITKYDVVFTRGNEVGRVATPAELVALLGSIDTPGEAVLVAFANGHYVPCDRTNFRREGSSYVIRARRGGGCGEGDDIEEYEVTVDASGKVTVGESEVVETGDPNCAVGRRPASLRSRGPRLDGVGSFFASAAHLEAASVPAFRHLARELSAHGAPPALVRAAERSAADEVRHARVVSQLARRYGRAASRPVVAHMPIRSLVDVALDNGSEGCVRETFGAVVAAVQARRAGDPVVRKAFDRIARDEARHAALSWSIDEWALSRLGQPEARRLREARELAAHTLGREIRRPVAPVVTAYAGVPDVAGSARLYAALSSEVFRA